MSSPAQLFFKKAASSKPVKCGERGLVFRSHHGAQTFLGDVRGALGKRKFWGDTPRLAVLLMDAIRGLYASSPDDLSVEYDCDFYIEKSSDRDAYFQVNILPGQSVQIQNLFSEAIVWSGSFVDYLSLNARFFDKIYEDVCLSGNDGDEEDVDESDRAPRSVKASRPARGGYFEYRLGTSSKFWEVSRKGASVTTRYGRIGTRGQQTATKFKAEELAKRALEKLVAEKIRKGYIARAAPSAVVRVMPQDEPWYPAGLVSFDDDVFLTTDRTGDLLEKVKRSIARVGPPSDPSDMSFCHHLVDNLRDIADMKNCALQAKALRKCKFNVGLSNARPVRGVDIEVAFSKKRMTVKTSSGRAETGRRR